MWKKKVTYKKTSCENTNVLINHDINTLISSAFYYQLLLSHVAMEVEIALDSLREERVYEGSINSHDGLRRRFQSQSEPHREFSLPQADRGKDAWLFLAGCFMVEALIWGEYPPTINNNVLRILQVSHSPLACSKNITPRMSPSLQSHRV